MSRFFEARVLALALSSTCFSCSSGEIGPPNSAPGDASTRDATRPSDAASRERDANEPRALHDASRAEASASRDAEPVRRDAGSRPDAGDGGRPLGTNPNDFFGESRCASAHVELCEDFESGVLDRGTWEVVGSPTIDGTQKARGQKALHILEVGNGAEYIRERKTFPEPNDTYWGRTFVYFERLPGAPMTYAHWTFIAASGTGVSGEIRVSGQFSSGRNLFGVGTDNRTDPNGTGDWTMSDEDPNGNPMPVPLHRWLCVEWMHSGSADETRLFIDGVEHPSLHTTATVNGGNGQPYLLPDFTNVWIGWQEYQTSTETFELWVDEIAIDGARIGCVI